MRKVRYIYKDVPGLTVNKVYDVLIHNKPGSEFWDNIIILNDYGEQSAHPIYTHTFKTLFIDATSVYRNETIDEILS